jgi:hypothetical protein
MSVYSGPEIATSGLILCLDADNSRSYSGSGTTWFDISGQGNNLTIYGNPIHNSSGYFTFSNDQTTQYMMLNSFPAPTSEITFSCWFRSRFTSTNQVPFTYSVGGNNEMLFYINSNTQFAPHPLGVSVPVDTSNMTNIWVNFVWSRISSTGRSAFYRDGVYIGEYVASAGTSITSNGYLIIGQEADTAGGSFDPLQNLDGDFARLDTYNRALSDSEVQQNFNALRGRFGI